MRSKSFHKHLKHENYLEIDSRVKITLDKVSSYLILKDSHENHLKIGEIDLETLSSSPLMEFSLREYFGKKGF